MIDHTANQKALRAYAIALSVCTTGAISLGVTKTGGAGGLSAFTRSDPGGSFITDGFVPGLELLAAAFGEATTNDYAVVAAVSATLLTVTRDLKTESAGAGRTLSVGLPILRAWENARFKPIAGRPYVEEQYLPGPGAAQVTTGPNGELEIFPQYALHVSAPSGFGMDAAAKYADKLITHFAPRTTITVGSDKLRVRWDVGPFPGQLLPRQPGWAMKPISFPLWLRTFNSI